MAVRDHAVATARFEAMGFRLTPYSPHSGAWRPGEKVQVLGSGNRCVMYAHIPYKGIAPALTAGIAGEVQLTLGGAATTRSHFQTGRLKPLAIARKERLALYPDVPTLREAGFPDIDPQPWFGLFAPGQTPRAFIQRIRDDVAAVLAEPEFREREIVGKGYTGVGGSPEEFAAFNRADFAYKGRLIKLSGAKAE